MLRKVTVYFLIVLMFLCCNIVNADTVAYWQFDDNEPGSTTTLGERVVDSSGYGRDLWTGETTASLPTYQPSNPMYGDGASIGLTAGVDELYFEPNHVFSDGGSNAGTAIDFGSTESFTIEAMVRIPATTTSTKLLAIVQKIATVGGFYYRFATSTSMTFSVTDVNNVGTNWTLTGLANCYDGNWHHIAAVRDAANGKLIMYLDYAQIGEKTISLGAFTGTAKWWIGAMSASSTREFIGSIDFIRISNAALLPADFIRSKAYDPSPADRAYDVAIPSVTLGWTPTSGTGVTVSSQVVEVAVDSNFENIIETFNLDGTATSATLTPIAASRGYYWRVNTTGIDNGTSFTEQGVTWYFQTVDANAIVLGYWKFDDIAIGTAIDANSKILDSSGNGRDLVPVSVSSSAVTNYGNPYAAYGNGASFENNKGRMLWLIPGYTHTDGSIAGSAPVLTLANGDMTIEAVVKVTNGNSTGNTIYSFLPLTDTDTWYGTTNTFYFRANDTTGYLRFAFDSGGVSKTVTGKTSVYDAWHHVAAVRKTATGELLLYIDGVLDANTIDTTVGLGDVFPTGNAVVGGFSSALNTSRNFNGNIDFVKVTHAALDTTEFVQAFAIPTNPNPVDGATGVPLIYTFSWTAITGATITSETVKIATDPYMQNIVQTITASGSSATISDLSNSTTYYWRVDTVGSDSNGSFSRQGEIWSFSTPNCLLDAADGDINGDCIIDFIDFATVAGNWLTSEYEE